jgi:fructose-specific PTS system IIA-like component
LPQNQKLDRTSEARKLDAGVSALAATFEGRLGRSASTVELELLRAHRSVARDPEFHARLHQELERDGGTAAGAILATEAHYCAMLTASPSALLRERAADLHDVCTQLLVQIYGKDAASPEIRLGRNSIVVADCLTPGQFLRLDRRRLKGLVLAQTSATSHTVILARSFGIPTLNALADVHPANLPGIEAILDGDAGILLTGLTPPARRYYQKERARLEERRARERRLTSRTVSVRERCRLEIAGNISTVEEAAAALEAGAVGIGLFRTEMLFLERDAPPTEEEQTEAYRRVLTLARNKPVIIRTIDIGGDKPLPYLKLPPEQNPFLGYRGVRIYREFEEILRTQIRALLRASAAGRLKIMVPMITSLEEVRWFKHLFREEHDRCGFNRQSSSGKIPIGAMIEIPAAGFLIDHLAPEVDFFSIGTNDLLQCFTAADRTNPRVGSICDPLQPAFLRLLHKIVTDARAKRKWIGLCGEMAAEPAHVVLLAGLGLDELSAAPSALRSLKAEVGRWSSSLSRQLLRRALRCSSPDQVRHLLGDYLARNSAPLIEPDLIITRSNSTTKAEAIKEAVDRLYVLSRTDQPRLVEHAIWQREAEHSTGFGHGFAIPHCKSARLNANSLAVIKLRKPVPWDSLDGQPVKVVVLIAIRDGDQGVTHMKILSSLARKIMHHDFRERLLREQDAGTLCHFLEQSLGLP